MRERETVLKRCVTKENKRNDGDHNEQLYNRLAFVKL